MKLIKKRIATQSLEKGQLWQMENTHLQIVEMGKRLTHYRLLHSLNQKGVPIRLGGIQEVQDYLKAKKAKLIKNEPQVTISPRKVRN